MNREPSEQSALEAEDVTVLSATGGPIVDDVALRIPTGEVLGLLGETGAGKTVTARSLVGLRPRGLRSSGRVRFGAGRWIDLADDRALAEHLGRSVGVMLQNAQAGFDPIQRLGRQFVEAVVTRRVMSKQDAVDRATELCRRVGLPDPDRIFRLFPHELSGGMAQRAALVLALMPAPNVLVVDEPTSALDANLRVEVLELLRSVAEADATGVLMISHDLGLVSQYCQEIAVLYAGRIVEAGPTPSVLRAPAHPYTSALIGCSLSMDAVPRVPLPIIGGEPALPGRWSSGCRFHPRCPLATNRCEIESPEARGSRRRAVACHFAELEEST